MKKLFYVLSLAGCIFMGSTAMAQSMGSSYRTALGFKFWPGGITIKHFVKDNRALEGILYFWDHGFRFTGLYEWHGDIRGAEGLKWYVGLGGHIGSYNEHWRHDDHHFEDGDMSFGLDGILGLDYKIDGAPINLSLDFQPSFELLHHGYFSGWGGLAIRFAF